MFLLIIIFFTPFLVRSLYEKVALTKIGEVEISGSLFDVDLETNYAYVSEYSASRVHIIDISDPMNLLEIGNFTVNLPHYFEVENAIAYIAAWNQGVQIFNVSNPNSPYKMSEFRPGIVGALTVQDNFLFVGSEEGFNIIDISNLVLPENLSYFYTGGNVHDFFVIESLLYIMTWNSTSDSSWIKIFNITNPEQPEELVNLF